MRKSWPSSTVTVEPPGAVVGGCAWTSESQVSAPNSREASMMPLVSQTPGPTGMPSRPGGSSWATRVAVETATPTAATGPLTGSNRQIEPSRPLAAMTVRLSVVPSSLIIRYWSLTSRLSGADGDVAARRDHRVGVVDNAEGRRLERVARVQPQRVQPPKLVAPVVGAAGGADGVEEELGWCSAKSSSQVGMVWVGTNTALVNPSGNTSRRRSLATAALTCSIVDRPHLPRHHHRNRRPLLPCRPHSYRLAHSRASSA